MPPSQLGSRLTMIAVDTNVLVRLIVRDDDVQARRAPALFEQNEIYVCKTVLLETEWVLRFSYKLDGATILDALKGAVGLPRVNAGRPCGCGGFGSRGGRDGLCRCIARGLQPGCGTVRHVR